MNVFLFWPIILLVLQFFTHKAWNVQPAVSVFMLHTWFPRSRKFFSWSELFIHEQSDPILPGLTLKYVSDGSISSSCPDKADRHQELTGWLQRSVSGKLKNKKDHPFMFYNKKEEGNDSGQIAFCACKRRIQRQADDDVGRGATNRLGGKVTSGASITPPFGPGL